MLIMSDASGPAADIGTEGYLTGYPLADSEFYAIARTWAAKEVRRPGCVWTHTLLIDIADLLSFENMEALMRLFRYPAGAPAAAYAEEILFQEPERWPETTVGSLQATSADALRRFVWALYAHPSECVIAAANQDSEKISFVLWGQQWPRLRRMFRFCTLSFADRSSDVGLFDLQFFPPSDKAIRSRFLNAVSVERIQVGSEKWLDSAVYDLQEGLHGNLRQFLRDYGNEIEGGRAAFLPLCQFHTLLGEVQNRPRAIDDAIALFKEKFQSESPNMLQRRLASTILNSHEEVSEQTAHFLLRYFELTNGEVGRDNLKRLGGIIWKFYPSSFERWFLQDLPQRQLGEHLISEMSAGALVDGLYKDQRLIEDVVKLRPDLLEVAAFWRIQGTWHADTLQKANGNPNRARRIVAAVIQSGRNDLAGSLVRRFGVRTMLQGALEDGLLSASGMTPSLSSEWLRYAFSDGEAIAEVLGRHLVRKRIELFTIASSTEPDFVPNDIGEDPWHTAYSHTTGDISDEQLQLLLAYLLARALGFRSRSAAELFGHSADYIYTAAAQSKLTVHSWSLIESRLPYSYSRPQWDHCPRIVAGVVRTFIERDLPPLAFSKLTSNDEFFLELTKAASRRGKSGRRFLRIVRQELLSVKSESSLTRADLIEKVLF